MNVKLMMMMIMMMMMMNLSWNKHIDVVVSEIFKTIRIFSKVQQSLLKLGTHKLYIYIVHVLAIVI